MGPVIVRSLPLRTQQALSHSEPLLNGGRRRWSHLRHELHEWAFGREMGGRKMGGLNRLDRNSRIWFPNRRAVRANDYQLNDRMKKRILVLGAGFGGLELSTMLS